MAARSRASITPSLSDALAFHTLTLPSSDPDNTNLASAVNAVENTLPVCGADVNRQGWMIKAGQFNLTVAFVWYGIPPVVSPPLLSKSVRCGPSHR